MGLFAFPQPISGGIYQYTRSLIAALQAATDRVESVILYMDPAWEKTDLFQSNGGANWRFVGQPGWKRGGSRGALILADRLGLPMNHWHLLSAYSRVIRECKLPLLIFPAPIRLAYEIGFPFLMTIHDMQHRLQPEFAEVSSESQGRDLIYRRCGENAEILMVPSATGAEDVLRFYDVDPARVKILPPVPADYLLQVAPTDRAALLARYQLPGRFLFYPAQFWTHKNHLGIVEALAILRREYRLNVPVVFAGSKKNGFSTVMDRVNALGISDLVFYLGYLSNEDMAAFYVNAQALIMPSFFGPTNIPVAEAFHLGCPVITSPVSGIPEQAGDAALMVDPRDPRAIADGIRQVWESESLRNALRQRGFQRVASWGQADFTARLIEIIEMVARPTVDVVPS